MGFLIIIFLIKKGMASGGDMIIKVSNVNAMLTKKNISATSSFFTLL